MEEIEQINNYEAKYKLTLELYPKSGEITNIHYVP